jgi:N-acetylmuramoyl-L-alanine amidase
VSVETSLECRFRPSPNFGPRAAGFTPDMLILHYTDMPSGEAAIDWLCNPASGVSCHYLVDDDGTITQMVVEDNRAWHAGAACWKNVGDINSCSIGIEIQNPGPEAGPPVFPEIQMAAVEALSLDIIARHTIAAERVLAHSDVAPGRKIDPGETFDWARLHKAGVGHWVACVADSEGPVLKPGDQGGEVERLQSLLKSYGYGIETTGIYDPATAHVVRAFQLHFRQERVDGQADLSTRLTLERLAAGVV